MIVKRNNKWTKGMSEQLNHRWVPTLNPSVERCVHCDVRRRKHGTSFVYGHRHGAGIAFDAARPNCVVGGTP